MRIAVLALGALATPAWAATFELAHQGRVLDVSGVPVDGSHLLTLRLYDGVGTPLTVQSFPGTAFQGGTYAVRLTGLQTDWFSGDVSLGVTLDAGPELSPREPLGTVPRSGRALVADRVAVSDVELSGDCTDAGAIRLDATAGTLAYCDGADWKRLAGSGTGPGTELVSGARRWADGSFALTCDGYRNPTNPEHEWNFVGSGLFDVDPESDGTPLRVWCDMDHDAFGWTMLVGSGAPSNCSFWTVGGAGTINCNAAQVSSATNSDTSGEYTLRLTPSWSFRHVRFTGSVFSSGGTGSPVWDWPDSGDRHGVGVGHSCGENTTYNRQHDLGSLGADAWWYAWSDYGNICGGSGASWTLTFVAIR